jgi:small GTP-binding protein
LTSLSKKICLLGDFAVGKSSLMRRFVYDRFDEKYMSTIGVKVSRKTIMVARENDVVELNMLLWDLAGSEEFSPVRASYLGGAEGAIVVCDLTRIETLRHLDLYLQEFYAVRASARVVVAANKWDLSDQHVFDAEDLVVTADKYDVPYYLTSAKEGDGVDVMFRALAKSLV